MYFYKQNYIHISKQLHAKRYPKHVLCATISSTGLLSQVDVASKVNVNDCVKTVCESVPSVVQTVGTYHLQHNKTDRGQTKHSQPSPKCQKHYLIEQKKCFVIKIYFCIYKHTV